MMGGCCGGGLWGFGGSFGLIGLLLNLVIFLAVIGGIVWLVIWLARRSSQGKSLFPPTTNLAPDEAMTAKEALQLRYARGEITREQYLEMLKDLE